MLLTAIVPIIWLFLALCLFRLPGHIVCPIGFAITIVLAVVFWGMSPDAIGSATLEGVLFGLWPILLVILASMIMYKYSVASGGMERIRELLSGVSTDKRVLVLILAWGFGGFLEGLAGFGTPVLIPGSILVSLGFNPFFAVVLCLVANTAATPFATMGIPVETLAGVTGLDVNLIADNIATQLFIPCLIIPFVLVVMTGRSWKAIKGVFLITLISGLSFALPLYFIASFVGPELPTLIGSVSAIFCTSVAGKFLYKDTEENKKYWISAPKDPVLDTAIDHSPGGKKRMSIFAACLPFLLVLIMVVSVNMIPLLSGAVNSLSNTVMIYTGEGGRPLTFSWVATPGILIIIATVISCVVQRQRIGKLLKIAAETVISSRRLFLMILSIISMAKIMYYCGMTDAIAIALIAVFGGMYPLISPFIGAFGVFITGSDTTCCVLFGNIQHGAATALGIEPTWIAASNLSGAAMGKMISPQSIAIGLGIGGLDGRDGEILLKTIGIGIVFTFLIGVIVFLGS